MTVAEDVGGDGDGVADGALDRVPPTVEDRRRLCDLIRRGGSLRFGAGISAVEYPTSRSHEPLSYLRGPAAPDLAAVRTARSGRLRVGRLARRGRPDVVADAAARPARRARLALQVGVGVRGLAGAARPSPRHRCAAAERAATSASAPPTGSRTGWRSRARRRWTTRSASTANGRALRAYADERGVKLIGDIPIYVAPGLRRPRSRTRRSSRRAPWPACRPTRSPTRASCGATRCTTGPRCAAPATAGGSRASAHLRALRPRADRPLPRLHRLLGGARGRRVRARRARGSAARAGRRSTRAQRGARASCR